MRIIFSSLFFLVSINAYCAQIDADGVVRDSQGQLIFLSQADAAKVCAANGMHLPSVFELMALYRPMGFWVEEIYDENQTPSHGPNSNYKCIGTTCYNSFSYRSPNNDLGNNWFWTSRRYLSSFGYFFMATVRSFNDYHPASLAKARDTRDWPWDIATRCVNNR